MKQVYWTVEDNRRIARDVYEMHLSGDTTAITTPGQFVNLKIDGCYLRRPLSVADRTDGAATLVYKVVGQGTAILSGMQAGTEIDVLAGLGNGFDVHRAGDAPLLIGGGVGTPPMYLLCRELVARGARPTVLLGFGTAEEVFYPDRFEALGARVIVATADGSMGVRGFVTDALSGISYTYFYACGPEPMFRALDRVLTGDGEYSFEERMGCGFGACMGCSCKTKYGYKRICTEGPVLRREEIIW